MTRDPPSAEQSPSARASRGWRISTKTASATHRERGADPEDRFAGALCGPCEGSACPGRESVPGNQSRSLGSSFFFRRRSSVARRARGDVGVESGWAAALRPGERQHGRPHRTLGSMRTSGRSFGSVSFSACGFIPYGTRMGRVAPPTRRSPYPAKKWSRRSDSNGRPAHYE